MSRTGALIVKHRESFPDHDYYKALLEKAEAEISNFPDITIETCKSVLEGVSKTILTKCGVTYKEKGRDADTAAQLFRKATAELQKYCDIDEEIVQSSAGTILRISTIRNDRGDISHGKRVPKDESSDAELARFVYEITDSICYYLLDKFLKADLSITEEVVYEGNEVFNEMLDSTYALPGGIKYSRALYEQDPVAYGEQLLEFKSVTE
jgi:hypothetical protein